VRIDGLNPNVGVTKNGNPYKKSEMGKRIGRDVGLGYVAYNTYKLAKNGTFTAMITPVLTRLSGVSKFIAKHPGVAKYGIIGGSVALAALVAGGIGKLVGHCVDKVVEARRKKAADNAAAVQ